MKILTLFFVFFLFPVSAQETLKQDGTIVSLNIDTIYFQERSSFSEVAIGEEREIYLGGILLAIFLSSLFVLIRNKKLLKKILIIILSVAMVSSGIACGTLFNEDPENNYRALTAAIINIAIASVMMLYSFVDRAQRTSEKEEN